MTPEQTRAQHLAQRNMVARSLLLAPTAQDRGEERPRRPRVARVARGAPVAVPDPAAHVYRMPIVTEARYL